MFQRFISFVQHQYYEILKISVFIIAIVLVLWFMPREGKFKYEFQKGKPWQQETVFAPFDFAIYKSPERLREEQSKALSKVYPYFIFQEQETRNGRTKLEDSFIQQWQKRKEGHLPKQKQLAYLLNLYDSIQGKGVIAYHKVLDNKSEHAMVNVVKNMVVKPEPLKNVFTIKSAYEYAKMWIDTANHVDKALISKLLANGFVQNMVYSETTTLKEQEQALEDVSPTYGMVQKDELIINEGELVDDQKFAILNSLRKEYERRVGTTAQQNALMAGQLILVAAIFVALFFFLRIIRREVFEELKKINLILLLMLMMSIPSFLILQYRPSLILLMPIGLLPIILITFFDTRITMMVHLLTITLIALVVPNPYQFVFLQFIIGFVVLFSLVNHNKRTYYFRSSVFIFLAYAFVYLGFTLIQEGNLQTVNTLVLGSFALNALFTMLALPLIYFLERIFGLLTDLSLLELSNTNSPLLRQLALVAPGTFQHSMQVANLSEEALYEIGGDTLLARTGALYHDIGKMENPLYFIENQMGGYNPHDDISSAESARIIIDHVTKGIEKARKAHLPEQIIDFIRTHHGNRRVEYFYFLEQKQNPGLSLDERDFSYHGPIPFSKETAVVMMADSVEAASRSIKTPSEQKLNDLVENIIGKQMETNQFINSNITLKEINTVKKVLKKKLMNIYHVRIAYPD